jgi:hypothetical protein
MDTYGVVIDTMPVGSPATTFTQTQNGIPDPLGERGAVRKRPGLIEYTTNVAAGAILGGIPVPLANTTLAGNPTIYLGKGVLS